MRTILVSICLSTSLYATATYPSGVPDYREEVALDSYWTEYELTDYEIRVPASPNVNGAYLVKLDYNMKGLAITTVCTETSGGGECLTETTSEGPLAGQFYHDVNWSQMFFNAAQDDDTYYVSGTYYSTTARARWTNDHRDDTELVIDGLVGDGFDHSIFPDDSNGSFIWHCGIPTNPWNTVYTLDVNAEDNIFADEIIAGSMQLTEPAAIQFTGDASGGPVHVLDFEGMSGVSSDDDLLHFTDLVRFSGGAIWYHLGARPSVPNIGNFGSSLEHFNRLFFREGFFGENDTVQLRESYLLVGDAELERVLMDLAAPPYVIVRADDSEEAIEVQDETLTERWTVYGDGVVEADAINTNFFSGWNGLTDATYYYETNAINDSGWSDDLNLGTLVTGARPVLETLKFRIYTAQTDDYITEISIAYKTDLASTTIWFTFDDYGNGTSGWETFEIDLSSLKLAADGHLLCEVLFANLPIQAGRLSWMSVDWRTERG
jgi:hypothetical protein